VAIGSHLGSATPDNAPNVRELDLFLYFTGKKEAARKAVEKKKRKLAEAKVVAKGNAV